MLIIDDIKHLCSNENIVLTDHLFTRMRQRKIRLQDIKHTIMNGDIIKQYPEDTPFPSCLINGDNLHTVCSLGEGKLYIITAYRPSPDIWEAGGAKKKEDNP